METTFEGVEEMVGVFRADEDGMVAGEPWDIALGEL